MAKFRREGQSTARAFAGPLENCPRGLVIGEILPIIRRHRGKSGHLCLPANAALVLAGPEQRVGTNNLFLISCEDTAVGN